MTIHFDSSILKVNKDGVRVISTTLEKGEKLLDGRTYNDLAKGKTPEVPEVETGGLTLDVETNSSVPTGVGPTGDQTHGDVLGSNDVPVSSGLTLNEDGTGTAAAEKTVGASEAEKVKKDAKDASAAASKNAKDASAAASKNAKDAAAAAKAKK